MKTPKVHKPTAEEIKASQPVPLPDMGDAAVRKARADALKGLLKRRGRSSTILTHGINASGRISDQNGTGPTFAAQVVRGG